MAPILAADDPRFPTPSRMFVAVVRQHALARVLSLSLLILTLEMEMQMVGVNPDPYPAVNPRVNPWVVFLISMRRS